MFVYKVSFRFLENCRQQCVATWWGGAVRGGRAGAGAGAGRVPVIGASKQRWGCVQLVGRPVWRTGDWRKVGGRMWVGRANIALGWHTPVSQHNTTTQPPITATIAAGKSEAFPARSGWWPMLAWRGQEWTGRRGRGRDESSDRSPYNSPVQVQ